MAEKTTIVSRTETYDENGVGVNFVLERDGNYVSATRTGGGIWDVQTPGGQVAYTGNDANQAGNAADDALNGVVPDHGDGLL